MRPLRRPPGPPPAREVLTLAELADWVGRSSAGLAALAGRGEIPGRRAGKEWRFAREAIAELFVDDPGEEQASSSAQAPGLFAWPAIVDRDEMMGAAELAQWLRLPRNTIYIRARAGTLPGMREEGEWRFRKSELLAWLRGDGPRPPRRRRAPAPEA